MIFFFEIKRVNIIQISSQKNCKVINTGPFVQKKKSKKNLKFFYQIFDKSNKFCDFDKSNKFCGGV